ncbi:MAG: hypothetical protein JXB14_02605 [Candidatus Altiarchaeota archaeon]|nr:hypothetical protein [Candidatus Altiarchaeota archaeon]
MAVVTQILCFSSGGERITDDVILNRLSNIDTITFTCGDSVCSGSTPSITVASNSITANRAAQFKIRVSCRESAGTYDCELTVVNP